MMLSMLAKRMNGLMRSFFFKPTTNSKTKQIQDALAELVPIKQKELVALKKEHGNKVRRGGKRACMGGGIDLIDWLIG